MPNAAQARLHETQPLQVFLDLPTLLQHKALQRSTGRLCITGPEGQVVTLFLDRGLVVYGSLGEDEIESFEPIFAEMFGWQEWHPQFDDALSPPILLEDRCHESMPGLVLGAMTKLDEDRADDCQFTEEKPSSPTEVRPSSSEDESDEMRAALGKMLRLPEVRAWLICNENGQVTSQGGFDSEAPRVAASLIRAYECAQAISRAFDFAPACSVEALLDQDLMIAVRCAGRYVVLQVDELLEARAFTSHLEKILGTRTQDSRSDRSLSAVAKPTSNLEADSEVCNRLFSLGAMNDVAGALVADRAGKLIFSSLPALPGAQVEVSRSVASLVGELHTTWKNCGDLAFFFDHAYQFRLKDLEGHGCLAILCRAETNVFLLDLPAKAVSRELTQAMVTREKVAKTHAIPVHREDVCAAAQTVLADYPHLEPAVMAFERTLSDEHDRSAWLDALGFEVGNLLFHHRLVSRQLLRCLNRPRSSTPKAFGDIIWPAVCRYSLELERGTAGATTTITSSSFCTGRPLASIPQGCFIKGLLRALLLGLGIDGVVIEEKSCVAMGDQACTFKVSKG